MGLKNIFLITPGKFWYPPPDITPPIPPGFRVFNNQNLTTMEILVKKTDAVVNGAISVMNAFTTDEFVGFKRGRKANWPSVQYHHGKNIKSTTFNLTEFAEQNPSLRVEKDAETFAITLPDQAYAEEGDRCPRPYLGKLIADPEKVTMKREK